MRNPQLWATTGDLDTSTDKAPCNHQVSKYAFIHMERKLGIDLMGLLCPYGLSFAFSPFKPLKRTGESKVLWRGTGIGELSPLATSNKDASSPNSLSHLTFIVFKRLGEL